VVLEPSEVELITTKTGGTRVAHALLELLFLILLLVVVAEGLLMPMPWLVAEPTELMLAVSARHMLAALVLLNDLVTSGAVLDVFGFSVLPQPQNERVVLL